MIYGVWAFTPLGSFEASIGNKWHCEIVAYQDWVHWRDNKKYPLDPTRVWRFGRTRKGGGRKGAASWIKNRMHASEKVCLIIIEQASDRILLIHTPPSHQS